MFKLTSFFLVAWLIMALFSGVLAGGGGVIVTSLTQDETAAATTLHVTSVTGLLDEDTLQIEAERVHYTGVAALTLTGVTRGYDSTEATAHDNGTQVYTLDASAMNSSLGFSVPYMADSMGYLSFIAIPISFITTTIPRAIAFNYNFLTGEMWLFGMIFYVLGIAFIFTLAWSVVGARRV